MRNKKSIFITAAVIVFAIIFFWIRSCYRIPVLMYHDIGSGSEHSRLIVSPKSFARQMKFLRDHHYNVLRMEDYVRLLKEKKRQPRHSVVITFDDGCSGVYTNAFPVLKKNIIPATVFVIPGWVNAHKPGYMNWKQIKELGNSGLIEIGSHSYSHRPMTELKENLVEAELRESRMMIEEKTGLKVRYFCYPCGAFNNRIKKETRALGYAAACATHPGSEIDLNDPYAIRRIRISRSADNMFIFRAQISGYYTFLKDRRVKYKNLNN